MRYYVFADYEQTTSLLFLQEVLLRFHLAHAVHDLQYKISY